MTFLILRSSHGVKGATERGRLKCSVSNIRGNRKVGNG